MSKAEKEIERRRPGRPPRDQRPVTPRVIEGFADMWLSGRTLRQIAAEFGVTRNTVAHHLDRSVRPLWRRRMEDRLSEEIAKIDYLERIAWQKFHQSEHPATKRQMKKALTEGGANLEVVEKVMTTIKRTGEAVWLHVVQWCVDARGRYLAYEPPKTVKVKAEYRVAGKSPDQVNAEMMARLMERVEQRKRYEKSLRDQGIDP